MGFSRTICDNLSLLKWLNAAVKEQSKYFSCVATVGSRFPFPKNTHWWSVFELFVYLVCENHWIDVVAFITTAQTIGEIVDEGAYLKKLVDMVRQPLFAATLELKLRVICSVALPLIKATYLLEGDGPCACTAYAVIMSAWDLLLGLAAVITKKKKLFPNFHNFSCITPTNFSLFLCFSHKNKI